MRSLLFKHFTVTAVLILGSFVALGVIFVTLSSHYVTEDKRDQLIRNAKIVSESAAQVFELDWAFHLSVSTVAGVTDAHILVCNKDGLVLVCSDESPCRHLGQTVPKAALQLASLGNYSEIGSFGRFYPQSSLTVGVPIVAPDGSVIGVTFATAEMQGASNLIMNYMRLFVVTAIIVLIAAYLSAFFAARQLTKPLKVMSRAAREFAHGNFEVRVPVKNEMSETGELASAFNAMADSLQNAEELRRGFIGNVSHELRTPMTTIAGYIEGILDGTIPQEKAHGYLHVIRDEVHRLSRLVRRMLDIARMQSGETELTLKDFDICELVSRVLLGFENRIDFKRLDVDASLPDTPLNVRADPDMITQVIYNLLDNAVKFAAGETVIEVAVKRVSSKATISISNSGVEIPPDDLPFIFGRFHKTDRSRAADRDGVGLGLYIVKVILDSHNQDINVESVSGRTTFSFSLACSPKSESHPKSLPHKSESNQKQNGQQE